MSLGRVKWSVTLLLFVWALGCSDDSTSVSNRRYSELSDSSFAVGDSSTLQISNFAGTVRVTPGAAGMVSVVATKWAAQEPDLGGIELEMVQLQNGARVETENPIHLTGVSVDLEVAAPPDARPFLQVAAGNIDYKGRAEGQSLFSTSAGNITLKLPADVNVEVHLSVASGSIRVDFPVNGQITEHRIDGAIGTGADGRIVAQVAAGKITVVSQ